MSNSYRVSAFDALSPRPTIRYVDSPRRFSEVPSRSSTRKGKDPAIPEEGDFSSRARIDEMADDMDTATLRQLMERDRRRRERKKKADREKLEKRLQRKLEKQKAEIVGQPDGEEDVKMKDADEPTPTAAEPSQLSPQVESSQQAEKRAPPPMPPQSPSSWLQDPSKESVVPETSRLEPASDDEKEEPVLQTAQAVRLSTASMSPPASPTQRKAGPTNLSLVTTSTDPPKPSSSEKADSDRLQVVDTRSSIKSGTSSRLMSIFRRSGTKRRPPTEKDRTASVPSEFSNVSRESLSRQQKAFPPPPVAAAAAAAERSFKPRIASGTPQRAKSKFKEDLPEYPQSPPASRHRAQSPETPASPTSPYIDDSAKVEAMDEEQRVSTPLGDVHPAFRDDVALNRSQLPRSGSAADNPSAALLSQSLASVDSEGSWLSGRPSKRSSIPITNPVRESGSSLPEQVSESAEEGAASTEPPTFERRDLEPTKHPRPGGLTSQLTAGTLGKPEDETGSGGLSVQTSPTEGEPKYDSVTGRHPLLVPTAAAHKSQEGLVEEGTSNSPTSVSTMTGNGDAGPSSSSAAAGAADEPPEVSPIEPESPYSPFGGVETAEVSLHRATSVDYNKGHSRRISAGSARILDIPPRSPSLAEKRNSALSISGMVSGAPSSVASPAIPKSTDEGDGGENEGEGNDVQRANRMSVQSASGQGLGLGLRLAPKVVDIQKQQQDPQAQPD